MKWLAYCAPGALLLGVAAAIAWRRAADDLERVLDGGADCFDESWFEVDADPDPGGPAPTAP